MTTMMASARWLAPSSSAALGFFSTYNDDADCPGEGVEHREACRQQATPTAKNARVASTPPTIGRNSTVPISVAAARFVTVMFALPDC